MFDEYNLNVKEHYRTVTWSDGEVFPDKLEGTNYPSNELLESSTKNKWQSRAIIVILSLLLLVSYCFKFGTNNQEKSNFEGFHLTNYDLVWPSEQCDYSVLDQIYKLSIQRKQNSKYGINLEGLDGLFNSVCLRGDVLDARGLFLKQLLLSHFSILQESQTIFSVISGDQIQYLFDQNTHDVGAQKYGKNSKVNIKMTVVNERGIQYLCIDVTDFESTEE